MLNTQFDPFPMLITERLILRKTNINDAEALFEIRSDPQVMQYIPRPMAKTVTDARVLIQLILNMMRKKEALVWTISLKEDSKMIGSIGFWSLKKQDFRAEVGYQLNTRFWRQGIVFEAMQAILAFGFEAMNCHSIEAIIDPKNIASEQLLLKCGFIKEAHFKENCFWNGQFLDSVVYSLLKKDAL